MATKNTKVLSGSTFNKWVTATSYTRIFIELDNLGESCYDMFVVSTNMSPSYDGDAPDGFITVHVWGWENNLTRERWSV